MDVSTFLCCGHSVFSSSDLHCIFLVSLIKLNVSDWSIFFLDITGIISDNFNCTNLGPPFLVNSVML